MRVNQKYLTQEIKNGNGVT